MIAKNIKTEYFPNSAKSEIFSTIVKMDYMTINDISQFESME